MLGSKPWHLPPERPPKLLAGGGNVDLGGGNVDLGGGNVDLPDRPTTAAQANPSYEHVLTDKWHKHD